MKTKSKIPFLLFVGILACGLSLGACRKKEEKVDEPTTTTDTDTEESTATDNNMAESITTDIESIGSDVAENGGLTAYKGEGAEGIEAAACATVSGYGTGTITVDFGTSCVGQDGRTRSGQLIYDFSASTPTTAIYYRNPGFSMKVTSQNYVVDGYSITILNKNVTNTTPSTIPSGMNPGTNLTWAITASVSIVKPNAGGTITWSCTRTKELMNTSDTTCYRGQAQKIIWSKAIVKLNGTASGVNARNENYTAVATNLIRNFGCSPDVLRPKRHPFIGGTINYTPGLRRARLIDYGNGVSCDLNATITINNVTHSITL